MTSEQTGKPGALHVWLCICMFFSGFSALVYEVAWLRLMSLTLGSTAYAASCALAIFLLGLALGAYVGGRLADLGRIRPLKLYGLVELGIGLFAVLVTPVLITAPNKILSLASNSSLGQFDPVLLIAIYSCLLLLPPTILMGATLPFVLKQIGQYARPEKSFGYIYGLNIMGAVLGSLTAAFYGFGYLGIHGTILVAALINCILGLLSLVFSFRLSQMVQSESTIPEQLNRDISPPANTVSETPFPFGFICLLAFSCGYSSLTFEVVWIRLLRFYNNSVTYTFTVMLSTFLLGLGLGSLIYKKFIEKKDKTTQEKILRFANLQYLAFIASGGCLIGIPICLVVNEHLSRGNNILNDPYYSLLILFLNSFICILIPATLLGMLFPILGTIAASGEQTRLASHVGIVYAINTLGCVLGSAISGLILVPIVGSYDTFQLAILFGVLCTALAVSKTSILGKNKKLAMTILPVLAALGFYLFAKYPIRHFIHATGTDRILFYGEDTTGTLFATQSTDYNCKSIIVNGSGYASTLIPNLRYMRILGHLPVLLHPDPKRVMIACFGTGSTAGAASVHPEVKELDIVELSNLIIKVGPLFSETSHDVLKNPKTTVYISDARHYLLSHTNKFDVISMEPPPPINAGVVSLYSTEFYKLVSARLNDKGIFAQWMPTQTASAVVWKMMLQSALKVFPHATIWLPNRGEAVLITSRSPIQFDAAKIKQRILASEAVQNSLKQISLDNPEAILSTYIMSDNRLRSFVGNVSDVTDDRPALEFFLPYLGPLLNDSDLLKYSNPDSADIVCRPTDVDWNMVKRLQQALMLSLKINHSTPGDKKKNNEILDQIERLDPKNNLYHFLRLWVKIDSG